jgi:hypothetical protein
MVPRTNRYPAQSIEVAEFPSSFANLFPRPEGLTDDWPPDQVTYLGQYLQRLGAKAIVTESHYIDRDYIFDFSVFYARSFRNYDNHCRRMHFFACALTKDQWKALFGTLDDAERKHITHELQAAYLGFVVLKPLPGSPIGRTVIRTFPSISETGSTRVFGGIRRYEVNLAGYQFTVDGLAFQQQDRGVSACATTALWSSLQKVAYDERMPVPTPAHITEAASRYLLTEGRSLPSEGLTIEQVCEGIRGAGLQPLVVRSVSPEEDRAALVACVRSGFPPVLAIQPLTGGSWHAICAVGIKMGDSNLLVAPAHHPHHARVSDALQALYVHDDRLGPYASAELFPWTHDENGQTRILTGVHIKWPDETQAELSVVHALIVPLPDKVRMSIARVLASGAWIAQAAGMFFKEFEGRVLLNAEYKRGTHYREKAFAFGLTESGLYRLCCGIALPRFLGVIEISASEGPLFDVLLDTTETRVNPSVLLLIKRAALPKPHEAALEVLADQFGAGLIV